MAATDALMLKVVGGNFVFFVDFAPDHYRRPRERLKSDGIEFKD